MTSDQPGMIGAALRELRAAVQARWVAMLDVDVPGGAIILAQAGDAPAQLAPLSALDDDGTGNRALLAQPLPLPSDRRAALVLTRSTAWNEMDRTQVRLAAAPLRVMWEQAPDGSGLDHLTGLPNHTYFLEEANRHIERLIQERAPGTLMLVELGDLGPVERVYGVPTRDQILILVGTLIRAMVRPADIVGRLGDTSFSVWLDGVDHMTAAERAEILCVRRIALAEAPNRPAIVVPPLSVGIASRAPDSDEDAREVLLRARDAAGFVQRTEGGGWHVSCGPT